MMRALAVLPVLASCAGPAPEPQTDAARILHQVALSEASLHGRDKRVPCILPRLEGAALDETRQYVKGRELQAAGDPALRARLTGRPAAPLFPWAAAPRDETEARVPLAPDAARRLNEAAARIIAAPPRPRRPGRAARRRLPPPLRACFADLPWRPSLSFSRPVIEGDLAFVETGYGCGGFCGHGLLYGLSRSGSGWKVLGVADTWVS